MHHPAPFSVSCRRSGFTLVELSIAIAIIGLLIGGVLVGRDLLSAAKMRAGIHQIEGYNAAINNFRLRYRGIPGDLRDATEQFSNTSWPLLVNGDGDGTLRDSTGPVPLADPPEDTDFAPEHNNFSGELPQFWYQLSASKMIDSQFDTSPTVGSGWPVSKAGEGGIGAYGITDDGNYYYIGMAAVVAGIIGTMPALTPEEASQFDKKLDDGSPLLGGVRAAGGGNLDGAPVMDTGTSRLACVYKPSGGTDDEAYYAIGAGGRTCQLRIRWQ